MLAEVTLRDVTDADLPTLFAHASDPVAVAMAAFTPADPEDRAAFAARWSALRGDPTVVVKAVECDGHLVGHIASWLLDGRRNVTYWVDRAWWGRGVATAALAAYLGLDARRPLFASVAADNIGSRRVLAKCGFVAFDAVAAHASARGRVIEEVLLRLDGPGSDAARGDVE